MPKQPLDGYRFARPRLRERREELAGRAGRALDQLRERRLALGLTQTRLAEITGVSQSMVAAVETGAEPASCNVQARLAAALQAEIEELFEPATASLSDPDLAACAGIGVHFVYDLERGDHRASPELQARLAASLGLFPCELFAPSETEERVPLYAAFLRTGIPHASLRGWVRRGLLPATRGPSGRREQLVSLVEVAIARRWYAETMTVKEATSVLGMARRTVLELCETGRLPARKVGRRSWRIGRAVVERLASTRRDIRERFASFAAAERLTGVPEKALKNLVAAGRLDVLDVSGRPELTDSKTPRLLERAQLRAVVEALTQSPETCPGLILAPETCPGTPLLPGRLYHPQCAGAVVGRAAREWWHDPERGSERRRRASERSTELLRNRWKHGLFSEEFIAYALGPRGRQRWLGRWKGREYGALGGRPRVSVSEEQRNEIEKLAEQGWGRRAIAGRLLVSERAVRHVLDELHRASA